MANDGCSATSNSSSSCDQQQYQWKSVISRRGDWKRGICIKLSEIDSRICDNFALNLRTLRVMYETKYQQFCANLACNWRHLYATPPSCISPSRGFLKKADALELWHSRQLRRSGAATMALAWMEIAA